MLEGALEGTVGFLALLGAVALGLRAARSGIRFVLHTAEIASVAGTADASARRGDITGLEDARTALGIARVKRRLNVAVTLGWASWLLVPLVLGGLPEAWALAAPLWLLPGGGGPRPGQQR